MLSVAVVVLTQLYASAHADSTHCRAIAGGSDALAAVDAETRLAWLERRLDSGAARARIWAWTWRAGYTGVVIVESALAATAHDTPTRAADVVGATSSAIGVLANVILPLKIMGDQSWWARHRAAARARGEDVCSLLNTVEILFIRDADSEAFGVGPLVHVGNFVINVAGGLVLGLGYNRWPAFAYTSLVGIGVGEVQVATQPTDAVEDLRLYRRGELDARPNPPRLGVALAPLAVPSG
ncbi:MAG TPA: hypothetical protein VGL86_17370, partial [Polyangia bacterium]